MEHSKRDIVKFSARSTAVHSESDSGGASHQPSKSKRRTRSSKSSSSAGSRKRGKRTKKRSAGMVAIRVRNRRIEHRMSHDDGAYVVCAGLLKLVGDVIM